MLNRHDARRVPPARVAKVIWPAANKERLFLPTGEPVLDMICVLEAGGNIATVTLPVDMFLAKSMHSAHIMLLINRCSDAVPGLARARLGVFYA